MNYYNYFTEIEEFFVKRRGKHLFVSPLDWCLIATWRDSGVPLHVALRGIDRAMDTYESKRHVPGSHVGSLSYCHESVMAEHAKYLEAHVGESSEAAGDSAVSDNTESEADAVRVFLSERLDEIRALHAKQLLGEEAQAGLARVLSRFEEMAGSLSAEKRIDTEALERDLELVDNLIVEVLTPCVTVEDREEWEKDAKRELKIYKKRLPKETYEKIRGNFLRMKLRRRFEIGDLSLFRM